MRAARKFLTANRLDRALVIRALIALTSAGTLVKFQPYARLRKRLQSTPQLRSVSPNRPAQDHLLHLLTAVAGRLPWATCLVQAIATQDILAQYGYASELRIGVTKAPSGEFSAHAWLEQNGTVLLGGANSPSTFSALDVAKVRASDLAGER